MDWGSRSPRTDQQSLRLTLDVVLWSPLSEPHLTTTERDNAVRTRWWQRSELCL